MGSSSSRVTRTNVVRDGERRCALRCWCRHTIGSIRIGRSVSAGHSRSVRRWCWGCGRNVLLARSMFLARLSRFGRRVWFLCLLRRIFGRAVRNLAASSSMGKLRVALIFGALLRRGAGLGCAMRHLPMRQQRATVVGCDRQRGYLDGRWRSMAGLSWRGTARVRASSGSGLQRLRRDRLLARLFRAVAVACLRGSRRCCASAGGGCLGGGGGSRACGGGCDWRSSWW